MTDETNQSDGPCTAVLATNGGQQVEGPFDYRTEALRLSAPGGCLWG